MTVRMNPTRHSMFFGEAEHLCTIQAELCCSEECSEMQKTVKQNDEISVSVSSRLTICALQMQSTVSLGSEMCPDARSPGAGCPHLPVPATARPSKSTPSPRTAGLAAPPTGTAAPSMVQPQDTDCVRPVQRRHPDRKCASGTGVLPLPMPATARPSERHCPHDHRPGNFHDRYSDIIYGPGYKLYNGCTEKEFRFRAHAQTHEARHNLSTSASARHCQAPRDHDI